MSPKRDPSAFTHSLELFDRFHRRKRMRARMYSHGAVPFTLTKFPVYEAAEADRQWWKESSLRPFQIIRSDRYERELAKAKLHQKHQETMAENARKRRRLEEAAEAQGKGGDDDFLRRQYDQDVYSGRIEEGKSGIYSGRDQTVSLEEQLRRSGFNPKVIQLTSRKELNLGPTDNPRDFLPELHEYLSNREQKEQFLQERAALRERQVDTQSMPDHVKKLDQATRNGQVYGEEAENDGPESAVASVGQKLGGQFAFQNVQPTPLEESMKRYGIRQEGEKDGHGFHLTEGMAKKTLDQQSHHGQPTSVTNRPGQGVGWEGAKAPIFPTLQDYMMSKMQTYGLLPAAQPAAVHMQRALAIAQSPPDSVLKLQ